MSNDTNTKELTLEERMDQLEILINRMESEEISLDESFALYKQGLAEVKAANDMLDSMEKAMMILTEDGEAYNEEF